MINISDRLVFLLCFAMLTIANGNAIPIHRALVIGIGQYEDSGWAKINGDNDVRYVVSMLEQLGYTDIRTLKNKGATKAGIVGELKDLAMRSNPGDRIYIHYSGHGQLMTDLNGDEATRWNGWHSQYDEAIVPYDAYMTYCEKDKGEKHISDDELSELLTSIREAVGKKGEIIVVLDSCYSGDATRGESYEVVRGVDMKFIIPKDADVPQSLPAKEQWLTISACRPYQLCTEIKGKRVGKLTYALYSLGRSFFKLGKKDMERYLDNFMRKYESRLPQTPMVSGHK